MKQRYKAIISYNGSNYHGWAKQPELPTVQGILEVTFKKLFNQPVRVFGSGRTDAGVNAWGQVIHFDLVDIAVKPKNLVTALNDALPYDIRIKKIAKAKDNFNCRFDAKNKTYVYSINMGMVNAMENTIVYQYNKELDIDKLKAVAEIFHGTHDFLSFSTHMRVGETVTKTIHKIKFKVKDNVLYIAITGSGFLRSQVRMMVGSMLAYAEGKTDLYNIRELLKNPKKGSSIYKAPACGLCLYKVRY